MEPQRINQKYLIKEISGVFNLEKGFFYTLKELVVRPGQSIQEFLYVDRNRMVKPVIFLIFCTLILTWTHQIFDVDLGNLKGELENLNEGVKSTIKWFQTFEGLNIILRGLFIGFATKLFFWKSRFNIYEIFVLIFYVTGMVNLIFAIVHIFESLYGTINGNISLFIGLAYSIWALGNFFNQKKTISYFKGGLAYFLGMAANYVFIISIGNLINIFI